MLLRLLVGVIVVIPLIPPFVFIEIGLIFIRLLGRLHVSCICLLLILEVSVLLIFIFSLFIVSFLFRFFNGLQRDLTDYFIKLHFCFRLAELLKRFEAFGDLPAFYFGEQFGDFLWRQRILEAGTLQFVHHPLFENIRFHQIISAGF